MGILRTDRVAGLGGANAITGSTFFGGGVTAGTGSAPQNNLQLRLSSDFNLGTNNFTIEAFIYLEALDQFNNILAVGTDSTNGYRMDLGTGNNLRFVTKLGSDGWGVLITGGTTFIKNKWYHVAATRSGNSFDLWVDGTKDATTVTNSGAVLDATVSSANGGTNNIGVEIGSLSTYGYSRKYNGYISNLHLVNGTALYTSNYTIPTTRLEKRSDTVILACNSAGNVLNEETGKTITKHSANTNSQGPVASRFTPNSPVGFSTTTDVGSQYGTTFDGFGSFATSTYMVPPAGNTRERNRGRALLGGGHNGSSHTNHIHRLSIQSQGNTEDFGDLTNARWIPAPSSSSTRGVWSGGGGPSPGSPTGAYVNFIDFVTIASPSNATDFGDQTAEKGYHTGLSNETRGIIAGGYNDSVGKINPIEYITIATAGNAQDFGDLTLARMQLAAAGSPTRGLFFGGSVSPNVNGNVVDYITIATTGNAQDFGDMTSTTKYGNATSSNTRAIYGGGLAPNDTTYVNTIEFFTIATLGNGTDFGDLTVNRSTTPGATSNNIRGIFAGGYAPGNLNSIDFVTIAATGNAIDFGDISFGLDMRGIGALSDSHGGLE